MKILIKYTWGDLERTYIKGELFCPKCGKQSIYEEQEEGDYYLGSDFYCSECDHDFTIQGPEKSRHIEIGEQIRVEL